MITFVQVVLIIIGIVSGASGFGHFDEDRRETPNVAAGTICLVVAFVALAGVVALELLVKR